MNTVEIMHIRLFALIGILVLGSCSKPETGSAKRALDELYPHADYLKTVYTESMIRSAANMAGLDSSFALSSHTDYIYQFEIEFDKRYYRSETDSVITHAITNSKLDKLFEYRTPKGYKSGYVLEKGGYINDAVFYQKDSAKIMLMEFVGNMPVDVLFKEGMKSYVEFGDILNLRLFNEERNDTTNQ